MSEKYSQTVVFTRLSESASSRLGTANGISPPPPPPTAARVRKIQALRNALRDRAFHPLSLRAQARRHVGPSLQGRGYGLAWCGLMLREGQADVAITARGLDGKGCGSPWCPVCGRHAAFEAQRWMQEAIAAATSQGYHVAFITLTQSHTAADSAEAALALHLRAREVWARRTGKKGHIGALDALEVTLGFNGWHWHTHRLAVSSTPFTAARIDALKSAWVKAVADSGGEATHENGCTVDAYRGAPADAPEWAAAIYAAKADSLAWEVAGAAAKRGKKGSISVVDLLALADDADARALAVDAMQAVVGKRKRFSAGRLASKLGIRNLSESPERVFDDVAAPDAGPPPKLAQISLGDLRLMCAKYKRAEAALVELAKRYGQRGVDRAVRWTHNHRGTVVPLAAAPLPPPPLPREQRPIGAWTYADWAAVAADASHPLADRARLYAVGGGVA